jgi:hypothetical protein
MRTSRREPGSTIRAHRGYDLDISGDGARVMTLSTELAMRVRLYDAVAVVKKGPTRSGWSRPKGVRVDHVSRAIPLAAQVSLATFHGV